MTMAIRAGRSRVGFAVLVLISSVGALLDSPAMAAPPSEDQRIADCIGSETAGRPWLYKTLWGIRDQEAGWIGAEVRNRNGTTDLGPFQINDSWIPPLARLLSREPADIRRWLRDDACFNVRAAIWILLGAYRRHGEFWNAVGRYHSPSRQRQNQYELAVARHLIRRFGHSIFQGDGAAVSGARSGASPPTQDTPTKIFGFGLLTMTKDGL